MLIFSWILRTLWSIVNWYAVVFFGIIYVKMLIVHQFIFPHKKMILRKNYSRSGSCFILMFYFYFSALHSDIPHLQNNQLADFLGQIICFLMLVDFHFVTNWNILEWIGSNGMINQILQTKRYYSEVALWYGPISHDMILYTLMMSWYGNTLRITGPCGRIQQPPVGFHSKTQ